MHVRIHQSTIKVRIKTRDMSLVRFTIECKKRILRPQRPNTDILTGYDLSIVTVIAMAVYSKTFRKSARKCSFKAAYLCSTT